jgi:uncharacterized membrane protein YqiK
MSGSVAPDKSPAKIAGMFDAIAGRYDLLNMVLSGGLDRYWRRCAISSLRLTGKERLLDVCSGTADVAIFERGSLWHTGVIAVGGDHFTNDIAVGLRTPIPDAEKVKREKAAEASANEQIIAAKAQEEAMKHVIPFKQKQIEQRQLEADAEKASRIRTAEGAAEARRIEAAGEADSRRKLADADAYRNEQIGKVASEQLERDGALISKHPLLIQKTMADKLSDKISVIIAAPPASGGFIGNSLLGNSTKVAQQGGNSAEDTR